MANYHSDEWIMERVREHWEEALTLFPKDRIVGIFLQGSQNYGLDYEGSDIDTKCIIVPEFKEICLNYKPISTTHIRKNNEHIDFKDIRLYMETFRKQNLNFLEILFTPYAIINPLYQEEWRKLITANEEIARMNEYRAVKSMKGIALEKFHAMEHKYPSKLDIVEQFGYDGKQVSHLIRVYDYLNRYTKKEKYKDCLIPTEELTPRIIDYKMLSIIPLDVARTEAQEYLNKIEKIADDFCEQTEEEESLEIRKLLQEVNYNIMKIAIMQEMWAK